jgi:hypothetical protein
MLICSHAPPGEVLETRHDSLGHNAVILCHDAPRGPGFTVAFVTPGDTVMSVGRANAMYTAFGQGRMEHQDYLRRTAAGLPGCSRIIRGVSDH